MDVLFVFPFCGRRKEEGSGFVLEIIIDGAKFSTMDEFYEEMERLLTRDLSWRTGRNMDAFHDLLRGGFGVHAYGEGVDFLWLHADKSRRDFGYDATARYWEAILKRCHPVNRPKIQEKVKAAQDHTGPTLFDIISEQILCKNSVYAHTLRFAEDAEDGTSACTDEKERQP